MKKTIVMLMMAALAAVAPLAGAEAVELSIWTSDQSNAYKAISEAERLAVDKSFDPAAEAGRTAGVESGLRFMTREDATVKIERLEMNWDAGKFDTKTLFEGKAKGGKVYEMRYGGEAETVPSLRITASDARGSVEWDNTYDGRFGSTERRISTEDMNEDEIIDRVKGIWARDHGAEPPIVEMENLSMGVATLHLYEEVKDSETESHTATWAWLDIDIATGKGENTVTGDPIDIRDI